MRISVHQTSKVVAILYAFLGLLYIPFGLLINAVSPPEERIPTVIWLLAPLLFAGLGYVVSAIMCALYNLVAGWVGGVEVSLEPSE
jgi:hypothetical protein